MSTDPRTILQTRAVGNALNALHNVHRATINWFCGTGKTRIGQRVRLALDSNLTVVFVPTITLLLDQYREWGLQHPELHRLRVYHDENEEADDRSHNADAIGGWVEAYDGPKVIFCTYHSAPLLAEGLQGKIITLAIFDEAHRTAGEQDRLFSFALSDDRFPIANRLFLTATPKQIGDEGETVYSMENVEVYGPIVDVLNCRESIDTQFICDYRVVILEVPEYPNTPEDRLAATAAGINRIATEFGCKKIVSYHSTVEGAKNLQAVFQSAYPQFPAFHANGEMRSKIINHNLLGFENAHQSIITNCQCLSEGVNIPGIDLIVFADPKHSDIGILQAIGRALRKDPANPDKIATIAIPLLNTSSQEFAKLRAVLAALRDTDRRVRGELNSEALSPIPHSSHTNWVLVRASAQRTPEWETKLGQTVRLYREQGPSRAETMDQNLVEMLTAHYANGNTAPVETEQHEFTTVRWTTILVETLCGKQPPIYKKTLAQLDPKIKGAIVDGLLTHWDRPIFSECRDRGINILEANWGDLTNAQVKSFLLNGVKIPPRHLNDFYQGLDLLELSLVDTTPEIPDSPDPHQPNPSSMAEIYDYNRLFLRIIDNNLRDRWKDIVIRHGLQGKTLETLGLTHRVTRESIRKGYQDALRLIRKKYCEIESPDNIGNWKPHIPDRIIPYFPGLILLEEQILEYNQRVRQKKYRIEHDLQQKKKFLQLFSEGIIRYFHGMILNDEIIQNYNEEVQSLRAETQRKIDVRTAKTKSAQATKAHNKARAKATKARNKARAYQAYLEAHDPDILLAKEVRKALQDLQF